MQIRGLMMSSTQPKVMSSTKVEIFETWQANGSKGDTLTVIMATHSFPVPTNLFLIF